MRCILKYMSWATKLANTMRYKQQYGIQAEITGTLPFVFSNIKHINRSGQGCLPHRRKILPTTVNEVAFGNKTTTTKPTTNQKPNNKPPQPKPPHNNPPSSN